MAEAQQGIGSVPRRWLYKRFGKIRVGQVGSQVHQVKKELELEFKRNKELLTKLREIEGIWIRLEAELNSAVQLNKDISHPDAGLGFYELTSTLFGRQGTGSGGIFTPGTPKIDMKKGVALSHGRFKEELFALGKDWTALEQAWGNAKISRISALKKGDLVNPLTGLENAITGLITTIGEKEQEYREKMKGVKNNFPRIAKQRQEQIIKPLYMNYSPYIRFRHTYKVIKPFVYDDSAKSVVLLEKTGFPKRSWERGLGLDENGYPLEIDDDGIVLLDKWMREIASNPWQMGVIRSKAGGEVFAAKCGDVARAGVRRVDRRFAGDEAYIDLIEMVSYIINEIDAVRDDLRDGRYHPYSKTTTDYIIHAERNMAGLLRQGSGNIRGDPREYTYVDAILRDKIRLAYDQFDAGNQLGYVSAQPSAFMTGSEEDNVKRAYMIRDFPGGSFVTGERNPTDINSAFDRRAIRARQPFLHWGRMYYYEDVSGINRFSENPYPHISTRGMAKYLLFWIATKTINISEAASAAENGIGYDIGPRDMGAPFLRNPYASATSMTKQ